MNIWRAWSKRDSAQCGGTLNIAHRGASAYAPENTVAAFVLAAQMGAQAIELDVQLSGDRQLVVCHDAIVNRTTNGTGAIRNLDLSTLQTFDAGYHFSDVAGGAPFRGQGLRIPTLAEVFAAIPSSLLVNVEMKAALPQTSEPTLRHCVGQALEVWLDEVADRGYRDRILLSSFDWSLVDAMRQSGIGVPTAYLIEPRANLNEAIAAAVDAGHAAIHPHESLIDEQSQPALEEAHTLGLAVNVWTVDDTGRMRDLLALGVDGIVTNRPDRLAKIRVED